MVHARNEQVFPCRTRGTSVILLADVVLVKFQERGMKCFSCDLATGRKAIPILLGPINLQIEDTQSAFENAVMNHTEHCWEDLDYMRTVRVSAISASDTRTKMKNSKFCKQRQMHQLKAVWDCILCPFSFHITNNRK